MIRCCSSTCSVQWYHCQCIGLEVVDSVEDWWCSDSCEASGNYIYCVCHKSTSENSVMVQCELGDDCEKDEWYHPSCLCVSPDSLPGKHCHANKMIKQLFN